MSMVSRSLAINCAYYEVRASNVLSFAWDILAKWCATLSAPDPNSRWT